MTFKTAVNIDCIYTELPLEKRFAAAAADGFRYVEFWDWADKDLALVKAQLAANQLQMATMSGDGPVSMCDPAKKQAYLERIRASIEVAKQLGCPNLVIHSDALQEWPQFAVPLSADYSYETKLCAMFDCLKTIAPWAEEAGLTFVLEALNVVRDHCGYFLQTSALSFDLVTATGSDAMKMLYDAYHMYLNEGKTCETLSKYLPKIGYIHIADSPGRHEPGTGAIRYERVFAHLNEIGYEGFVGFEFYPQSDSETAIKAVKAALA